MTKKLGVWAKLEKINPGFKQFLVKSIIFIVLFILIQLITMSLVAKTQFPGKIKPFAMDDLAESVFFVIVIFLAFNKNKLLKIKKYSVGLKQRIISAILIILLFPVYFQYKRFMLANIEMVKEFLWLFSSIEYLILFIILFFLISLVFGFRFIKDFFKDHKKGLGLVLIGTIVVYNLIKWSQDLWPHLSRFVGKSAVYLLRFFGDASFKFSNNLPVVMFNNFGAGIAKTCSGIDSIFLFTALYLGVLAWDYKILNKKKVAIMFLPGVVGAFMLNIVRIFLLFLVGAYVSRDFALHAFHTNASAILFLIYFGVFWWALYGWMKK